MKRPKSKPEHFGTEILHSPVLEDASQHGFAQAPENLSELKEGDHVAIMPPFDAPKQIIVKVLKIERTERDDETGYLNVPVTLLGRIGRGETWGTANRPDDPSYKSGAVIRFAAANICHIY